MSAHTPGPWSWSGAFSARDGSSTESLLGAGGYGVLSCDGLGNSPREADARLIAAAPELLAALIAMRTMMDCGAQPRKLDEAITWRENDELARRLCDEAIAKATGSQP